MSTEQLQETKRELEAHPLFDRYKETRFRKDERSGELQAFAGEYDALMDLLKQRETLRLQVQVAAGASGRRVEEAPEAKKARHLAFFPTANKEFVNEKGKVNRSLLEQASRNHEAGVQFLAMRELVPEKDSPAMATLEAAGHDEVIKDLGELRQRADEGVARCKRVAQLLLIAHKYDWNVVAKMEGASGLSGLDESEQRALKEALEEVQKDEERAAKRKASEAKSDQGDKGKRWQGRRSFGHLDASASGFGGFNPYFANHAGGAGRGAFLAPPSVGQFQQQSYPQGFGRGNGRGSS